MASLSKVVSYMVDHAKPLAKEVVEGVIHNMQLEIPEWEKEQAISMYIEFINFLGESLIESKEGVPEDVIVWSKRNAEQQVSSGKKISEIIVRYSPTRDVFTELIKRISLRFKLSTEETTIILNRINSMLDISLNETVFAFEDFTDKYREEAQREMAELSAPVVLIKEGVAVLPLIGTIDSYRSTYILEKVVPKIAEQQIDYLIVDFSGILTFNEKIASYLRQLRDMFELLGINMIVTGLRPDLVQTIVNKGMDMSSIRAFQYVKEALKNIEKMSNP